MNLDRKFIDSLPKAELHLHLEGTLEPAHFLALAKRNNIEIPYRTVADVKRAYRFGNLQEFLDIYYRGSRVLVQERDFFELTWAYLERARAENIRHVEVFFDPQAHTSRGVHFDTVLSGIAEALEKGARELGISSRLIMCFLRDLNLASAFEALEQACEHKDRISAVGLDSAEAGYPPGKFKDLFDLAKAEGFRTVAHAGEDGPPSNILEAIDILGIERIDHGIACIEDDGLMTRLAEMKMPLTVCPLSTVKLGMVERMQDHPLRAMLESGLMVTVNSDDPAYFGGYLNENYWLAATALNLSQAQIYRLARNSFQASFLDHARKAELLSELDAHAGNRSIGTG